MHRLPFYRPLICASLGLVSHPVFAALQPVAEAPLASDTELHCHFNRDASTDCTTTYHYTILKPSGREMLSRIDFSYPEGDGFELLKAESIEPGGKPVPLDKTQIDTRTAPNPDQGFSREKQTSLAFPNLRVGTQVRYTVREHHAAKPLMTEFHYALQFGPSAARRDRFKIRFTAERPIEWRSELMDGFTLTPSANRKTLDVVQKAPTYVNYINESANAYIRMNPRIEVGSSLDRQQYFGPFAQRYNEILGANLPTHSAAAVASALDLPHAQSLGADAAHQRSLPLLGRLARVGSRLYTVQPGADRTARLRRLQRPVDLAGSDAQGQRDQGRKRVGQPRRCGRIPTDSGH